jgi:hypothetical protein
VLPGGVAEPTVVGKLVPAIDRLLRARNRDFLPEAKVRLRVAIHQGLVHLDGATGFPGEAVVAVCRLLDARPLKRALAAFPTAAVALIVSEEIYRDVVHEEYEGLRPERFRMVQVDMPDRGFRARAWICVVDEDVTVIADLGETDEPSSPVDPTGPPEPSDPRGQRDRGGPDHGGPDHDGLDHDRLGHDGPGGMSAGDVTTTGGQSAVGPGAIAIGSAGDNAKIGSWGRQ